MGLALIVCGCGPRTLHELSEPVGSICPETASGEIDGAFICPTDSRTAQYEFRREAPDDLHIVLCNPTASAHDDVLTGAFHVDVRDAVLGSHELPGVRST